MIGYQDMLQLGLTGYLNYRIRLTLVLFLSFCKKVSLITLFQKNKQSE